MGQFALPKKYILTAGGFGFLLFSMNFVILFSEFGETLKANPLIFVGVLAGSLIYLGFIIKVITEPVTQLKQMSKEEMDDHEYERINVSETAPNEDTIQTSSS